QDQSVLAIVDDIHWLDTASAEALRFAARRLGDEPVGVLLALRPGEFEPGGIPVLTIGGLAGQASPRAPPAGHAPPRPHARVAGGKALALVELPSLLSSRQLDGHDPLDDPLHAGERIERAFLARLAGLPETTKTSLLVAAAGGEHAIDGIIGALAALGLDAAA